jgi:hypothetical protein
VKNVVKGQHESVYMFIRLGPFRPKGIQDDVRQTLRAVLSLEKRLMRKPRVSTKGDTMKVEGAGIVISTRGREGWISLVTDIRSPVSAAKLAIANRYNNSVADYLRELFGGKMDVKTTVAITERLPPIKMAKYFFPEVLQQIGKALGFEVVPDGIWLTPKSKGRHESIIVTPSNRHHEVVYVYNSPTGSDMQKDILTETYKKLRVPVSKLRSVLQAG